MASFSDCNSQIHRFCVSLPDLHFRGTMHLRRREMNVNTEAILALPAAEKLELIGL